MHAHTAYVCVYSTETLCVLSLSDTVAVVSSDTDAVAMDMDVVTTETTLESEPVVQPL